MADPHPNMPPEQVASIQYQSEHIHDNRQAVIIGASWVLWVAAIIAILLRFYAKSMIRSKFKAEDGIILVALFFATGLAIANTISTFHGGGLHWVRLTPADVVSNIKLLYAVGQIYITSVAATKLSVLLFLHRTFHPNRTFRIAVWFVGISVTCWWMGTLLSIIFQCTPITFYWDKTKGGHCTNSARAAFVPDVINIVFNLIIVGMPVPVVWKLDMPTGRKVVVCGIFLLGGIITVVSIIRMIYVQNLNTYDLTYEWVDIGILTSVEPNIGIVGACLPLMAPVLRMVKQISTEKSYGKSDSTGNTWPHSRLKDGQTKASQQQQQQQQQHWRKGSIGCQPQRYTHSDDAVLLTRHIEVTTSKRDDSSGQKSNYDFEMQAIAQRAPTVHAGDGKGLRTELRFFKRIKRSISIFY